MIKRLMVAGLLISMAGLNFAQQNNTLNNIVHVHGQLPRDDDGSSNYQHCQDIGITWYNAAAIQLSLDVSQVVNPNQLPLPNLKEAQGIQFDRAPVISFLGIQDTYGYLFDAGNYKGVLVEAKLLDDQKYILQHIILTSQEKNKQYIGQLVLSRANESCAINLEQNA